MGLYPHDRKDCTPDETYKYGLSKRKPTKNPIRDGWGGMYLYVCQMDQNTGV